jgi:hypothetical protein
MFSGRRTNSGSVARALLLVLFFLVVFSPAVSNAQEKPALVVRVERALKRNQRIWKVERTDVSEVSSPPIYFIYLRSGGITWDIDLIIASTEEQARGNLEGFSLSLGQMKGVRKRSLPKLGDENYLWTGRIIQPTIMFRRGTLYVHIAAPTATIAERAARLILAQTLISPWISRASES